MTYLPPEIARKIEAAGSKGHKELDLHGCVIGINAPEIFSEIIKLDHLETLDLSGTGIPALFSTPTNKSHNLSSLIVSNNDLKQFPEWIRHFPNLTSLDISRNYLKLPKWLSKLKNLTSLNVSSNHLRTLPEEISELKNLTSLSAGNNELSVLPESICKLRKLTSLNVSNNRLSALVERMIELGDLTSLDISHNSFKELPKELRLLTNLTWLNLRDFNAYVYYSWILPGWIGELNKLTSLNVSSARLSKLPEEIGELKNLTSLDVSANRFSELPKEIQGLTNLTQLNISNLGSSQKFTLPEWIGELQNLTSLNVSSNHLRTLPEGLRALGNLTELRAGDNFFNTLPEVVYELTNLRTLILPNSSIKELSAKILQLEGLQHIDVSQNALITPPPEITRKGVEGIKRYFRQLGDAGLDYLYEAKLLVLGEGGAGKTSLAKKIENSNYQLRADEDSTKGIDVITWNFTADNQKPFRANIWDFGGQEIYHTTHQFFLTKRSLYILVADTRKEDTDFYYWLNVVELLSDNSPLLIVKNEKQERHRDINERQLRGEFDNLKETLAVNLATNRGLTDVLDRIKYHLTHLDHIGSPLPKTWLRVRAALESDHRNYISTVEYYSICEQHGFRDTKDKLQLIGYLHDLGVCLHFHGDALLRKTVILKPEWGTDAVYMVLDNREVINNLGKFNRQDLAHIWFDDKYLDMQDELLQLMINFKLCYRIPDSDYYIAPQLLTENQPNYQWDEKENLLLRYTYEFMPKGIITQFIVVMHKLISEGRLVWRSGVVLEKEQTRAEVIEHYGRREIRIRVGGQHKKELMSVVNYELDKIHNSYKRLKYKQLVPCNCGECKDSQEPHFFTLDTLRKFYGDRQELIQCQNSYDMVSVRGLIDEIAERENVFHEARSQNTSMVVNIFKSEVESVGIQQAVAGDNLMTHKKANVSVKSPWVSGSFYVFVFAVVICGLGVLANTVPVFVLPILLIAGVIFIPVIGALQLRQDERLSDKSFIKLMEITVGQLPLIRKLGEPKS
jgi:internalin A